MQVSFLQLINILSCLYDTTYAPHSSICPTTSLHSSALIATKLNSLSSTQPISIGQCTVNQNMCWNVDAVPRLTHAPVISVSIRASTQAPRQSSMAERPHAPQPTQTILTAPVHPSVNANVGEVPAEPQYTGLSSFCNKKPQYTEGRKNTNHGNTGWISADRRTKPTLNAYNTRMLLSRLQMIYHFQLLNLQLVSLSLHVVHTCSEKQPDEFGPRPILSAYIAIRGV